MRRRWLAGLLYIIVVVVHRYIRRLPGNITFAGAQIRAEFGRNISNITCNLFLGHKLLNLHTDSRERKLIKFSRQNIPPKVHKYTMNMYRPSAVVGTGQKVFRPQNLHNVMKNQHHNYVFFAHFGCPHTHTHAHTIVAYAILTGARALMF